MTPIGINNGNFRSGDYLDWAKQDLSNVPTFDQLIESKKIAETYGEGWEQDADNIHALIVAAEAGNVALHPVEAAYALETDSEDGTHPSPIISGGEVLYPSYAVAIDPNEPPADMADDFPF